MLQSNAVNAGNRRSKATVNSDYNRPQPNFFMAEGNLALCQYSSAQESPDEQYRSAKGGMFASVRNMFSGIRKGFSAIGRYLSREPQLLPDNPTPEEQEILDTITDIGFGEVSFNVVNKQIILSTIKVTADYMFSKPYVATQRISRVFNREQRSLIQLLRNCPNFEVRLYVKAQNGYPHMARLTYGLFGNKAN